MEKRKRVLLRADGNSKIGLGHITRSIVLGTILKEDFECILCTRFVSAHVRSVAAENDIALIKLSEGDDHYVQFSGFVDFEDIVVLDNYYFNTEYQKKLKEKGCQLVCIDDLHAQLFVSDIVINHSPSVTVSDYLVHNRTNLLLGLDYVLLRKPFLKPEYRKTNNQTDNILICFGGSDYYNLSLKTAKEVLEVNQNIRLTIVIGSSYAYKSELHSFVYKKSNISVLENIDENGMIKHISNASMAIVPCSTILFEVIALKTPFITGYYADNQKEISDYFERQGDVVKGDFRLTKITVGDFDMALSKKSNFSYIDGQSHDRLLNAFRNITN
ncbi:MAG: UDP-2,4-diacetamido-2,4,6-trideoxy-beta-L-altropyranose hydrolase [Cyclobacteriaceae bacterium]